MKERNTAINRDFNKGISVKQLAIKYSLSESQIYRITAPSRTKRSSISKELGEEMLRKFDESKLSEREIFLQHRADWGVSESAFSKFLRRKGREARHGKRETPSNLRSEVVALYSQGKNYVETTKETGVSEYAVREIIKEEGIGRGSAVFNLNHRYFQHIDTERKAYWLGLLYADGSVREVKKSKKGKSFIITIQLDIKDGLILQQFLNDVGSNKKIRIYNREEKHKKRKMVHATIYSKDMFEDLGRLGVVPNKTLKIKSLPTILDKSLYRHFVRGYMDGDGSVYKASKNSGTRVAFYGQKPFLEKLQSIINYSIGKRSRLKVTQQKTANVALFSYGAKRDIENLYNWLYSEATIFFPRKKSKMEITD